MTLARTIRMALLVALLSVAITALGSELFYMHWLRSIVFHGRRSGQQTSAESYDHDIRASLPAGSSRIQVETALRYKHLDFHYAAPREIDAAASGLKGSDPRATATLSLRFHFDGHDALVSIDSSTANTSP
jgi:hypothetical protein